MIFTADPYRDFENHEEEKEQWLATRPTCDRCGEPIQEEYCYDVDGEIICESCVEEFRRRIED